MLGGARAALARVGALFVLAALLGLSTRALLTVSDVGDTVAWASSAGVVIGEVVTRGAAASDQYVELYNASAGPVELGGLELAYVTASGTTTTVKQNWDGLPLPPGAHLLIANAAGAYAPLADGTFSGGFSTVGGTLVLRDRESGAVVDALSWGSAANQFVEGAPGQAPPTGASLERLPGEGANWVDTNDNAADTLVQPAPLAQNLASAPQPAPIPSPTPTAAACATTPPTDAPTASPASPSPLPSATATPSATPTAEPAMPIQDARGQPVGAAVVVSGTVTVAPGRILGDATLALEDDSGGIYARLPAPVPADVAAGDIVRVEGVLAAPYGNLEIRPAADGLTVLGHGAAVAPRDLYVGELGEPTEGLLARVAGTVESVSASSSGSVTVMLTDPTGTGRVFIHDTLGLGGGDFARGERLSVSGLVGDRLGLYRIWPRSSSDIELLGLPTPSPTRTPAATPTPTAKPSAAPTPAAGDVISIGQALGRQGRVVTVVGTVSVRAGLLDSDGRRVTIQDQSGAILVHLPDNETTAVGDRIRISGTVGTYYGAPQLSATTLAGLSRAQPSALTVDSGPLAASLEWRLVTVSGAITAVTHDGDSWRAELGLDGGSIPVSGLSRSGIPATAVQVGRSATITGLVKRAYPTASDQRFALVPRDESDIVLGAAIASAAPSMQPSSVPGTMPAGPNGPSTSVEPGGAAGGSAAPAPSVALGELSAHLGETVTVGGRVVTVGAEAITITDGSGSAVLLLGGPAADLASAFIPGDLLNAVGVAVDGPAGRPAIAIVDAQAVARVAQLAAAASPSPPPTYWTALPAAPSDTPPGSSGSPFLVLLIVLSLSGGALLAAAHPRVRAAIRQRLADARVRLAAARTAHMGRGGG